jgi:predicted alpha/beta-fold hydrolase
VIGPFLPLDFSYGLQFFHGARIEDAHSAAAILRDRVKGNDQVLAGVGYSLGAIVLNHYVASFGNQVALDVSVAISGALDCTFQQFYNRSQRIWQSMIIAHMKDQYLYPKWGDRIHRQIGQKHYQSLMRAGNIVVSRGVLSVAVLRRSILWHSFQVIVCDRMLIPI